MGGCRCTGWQSDVALPPPFQGCVGGLVGARGCGLTLTPASTPRLLPSFEGCAVVGEDGAIVGNLSVADVRDLAEVVLSGEDVEAVLAGTVISVRLVAGARTATPTTSSPPYLPQANMETWIGSFRSLSLPPSLPPSLPTISHTTTLPYPIASMQHLGRHGDGATPRRPPVTAGIADTLATVIQLLCVVGVHRVHVVDTLRKPVGVVTVSDVLRVLLSPELTAYVHMGWATQQAWHWVPSVPSISFRLPPAGLCVLMPALCACDPPPPPPPGTPRALHLALQRLVLLPPWLQRPCPLPSQPLGPSCVRAHPSSHPPRVVLLTFPPPPVATYFSPPPHLVANDGNFASLQWYPGLNTPLRPPTHPPPRKHVAQQAASRGLPSQHPCDGALPSCLLHVCVHTRCGTA
jgi:CBS domain-containing protein